MMFLDVSIAYGANRICCPDSLVFSLTHVTNDPCGGGVIELRTIRGDSQLAHSLGKHSPRHELILEAGGRAPTVVDCE